METPSKTIHFELSLPDYHAMSKHVCAPASTGRRMVGHLLWLFAVFVTSLGLMLFFRNWKALYAGLIAGILLMLVKMLLTQRRLQPRPGGAWLCQHDMQLTPGGVRVQTPHWTCELPWHGILAVEETAAHYFFRIDTIGAYTIPKRSFPNGEAMREFIDFARGAVSRAQPAGRDRVL